VGLGVWKPFWDRKHFQAFFKKSCTGVVCQRRIATKKSQNGSAGISSLPFHLQCWLKKNTSLCKALLTHRRSDLCKEEFILQVLCLKPLLFNMCKLLNMVRLNLMIKLLCGIRPLTSACLKGSWCCWT